MTYIVKNFIEQNIDNIETQQWDKLLHNWLEDACIYFEYDDSLFNELTEVINSCGIDFLKASYKDRLSKIADHIDDNIYNKVRVRNTISTGSPIKIKHCLKSLDSYLGFKESEIVLLIKEIADQQYDLISDGEYLKPSIYFSTQ